MELIRIVVDQWVGINMVGKFTQSASKNKRSERCRNKTGLRSKRFGLQQRWIPLFAVFLTAHSASALPNGGSFSASTQEGLPSGVSSLGEEFQPCEGCPTFVRVPEAPADLRRIEYVAKYPLTWREYLLSVNEKSCPAPSQVFNISGRSYSAESYLDQLAIDWPISILNQEEIECFKLWLSEKMTYSVEIPDEREWEWFALAGRTNSRFPWGNSTENPPAAVRGVKIATKNILTGIRDQAGVFLVRGVRVGLFPPNAWGLYDIIGNEYQLTSNVYSGSEWYRLHPHAANSGAMLGHSVVLVKGGHAATDVSKIGSVYHSDALRIIDGRFSANVSLRFVLVRSKGDE
jgi:formylglycine-generating enzyme required for sulfatase activity